MDHRDEAPDQVWEALEYEIARAELEYDDNHRAYRMRDWFLLKEFIAAERLGCCGSFESSTIVDGDKWIIACNYGH